MPSEKHSALVALGARWMKQNGFGVVATELQGAYSREQADVIGFRSTCTAIIEVKVSRADFLADRKKPERIHGVGLGVYRFFLTPSDLVQPEEMPARWGLLYEERGRVIDVLRPPGNMWCQYTTERTVLPEWARFQHTPDLTAERSILYSVARRLQTGRRDRGV